MNVLSLFDGISCGMIALERAGIKVDQYDAYEIDNNAIKISEYNYPEINHKGNVFDAVYTEGQYDLLIGGSPCTYWSIAQSKDKRETKPSGLGWDLFSQYVRALKEVKPKYFLYENNYSISKEIKVEITKALGVEPIYINSALVSGQNRKRLYWTNIPSSVPKDKNIKLYDVVDFSKEKFKPVGNWVWKYWRKKRKIDMLYDIHSPKSHTLTTRKTHPTGYYLNEDHTKYCNLTVEDWEKLQTLPVGYCGNVPVSDGVKYKAIGNGWTISVIENFFKNLPYKRKKDDNGKWIEDKR